MSLTIRTVEQISEEALVAHKARCVAAIDAHIEAVARSMRYNSAAHAAGYVTSTVAAWAQEATAFAAWRDAVWLAAFAVLDAADPTEPPSVENLLAALPSWQQLGEPT